MDPGPADLPVARDDEGAQCVGCGEVAVAVDVDRVGPGHWTQEAKGKISVRGRDVSASR